MKGVQTRFSVCYLCGTRRNFRADKVRRDLSNLPVSRTQGKSGDYTPYTREPLCYKVLSQAKGPGTITVNCNAKGKAVQNKEEQGDGLEYHGCQFST